MRTISDLVKVKQTVCLSSESAFGQNRKRLASVDGCLCESEVDGFFHSNGRVKTREDRMDGPRPS